MNLKTFGFHALLLGLVADILFGFVMAGNRSVYFVVLDLSIVGIVLSICGLVFDKKKFICLAAGLLCLAPIVLHWIIQKLGSGDGA
jgi:hypothetical protein